MLPDPGKVVGYNDLETLAAAKAPDIYQDLDADLAAHGGVLGSEFTPGKACQIYIGWMVPIVANAMAREVDQPPEKFVSDSMKLGVLLADRILGPAPFEPTTSGIKDNLTSVEDFFDRVLAAPMQYLNQRDTLRDLLSTYATSFAESDHANSRATIIGGHILMQIERRQYQTFCSEQVAKFRSQLDNLDPSQVTGEDQPPTTTA